LGVVGLLKTIWSLCCCSVCSKREDTSILNNDKTTPLRQPTAMLLTGRCHITLSPLKNPRCNAAVRQNSLTTCCFYFNVFRPTLRQSRPNTAGLKCPSVRPSVRTYLRPQQVSSISVKFGMYEVRRGR